MSTIKALEEKFNHWDKQLASSIEKLKEAINTTDYFKVDGKLNGYFSSSINVAAEEDGENCVIGSFRIQNLSNRTLKQLSICLTVKLDIPHKFSGKYATANMLKQATSTPYQWKLMNEEEKEDGVYWFRLLDEKGLDSFDEVIFPDFNVSWDHHVPCSLHINGFIYSETNPEGMSANNSIHLAIE